MAPNNALRPKAEEERERLDAQALSESWGVVSKEEVAARGSGTTSSPIDDFNAQNHSELRTIFTGIMFITRLPCPGWCDHHPGYLMRSMAWFPVLGAMVGAWCAAFVDAFALVLPPAVAAAMATGASLWLTGCFHEDGLGDTMDGFGGGWTKGQIMRIMKDSRTGTYGCMGLILYATTKVLLLGHLGRSAWVLGASSGQGPAFLVAQAVARATSAPLIYSCDYVLDDDDAKGEYYNWFGRSRDLLSPGRVVFAVASAAAIAIAVLGTSARVLAIGLMLLLAICFAAFYGNSIIGGVMGDYLGATICLTELAIYAVLAADLSYVEDVAARHGWSTALRPIAVLVVTVVLPFAWSKYAYSMPKTKEC